MTRNEGIVDHIIVKEVVGVVVVFAPSKTEHLGRIRLEQG
jgi:hypothetical protein